MKFEKNLNFKNEVRIWKKNKFYIPTFATGFTLKTGNQQTGYHLTSLFTVL